MSVQAQEQQRHQWLEAIGIDSWLPRAPLPGAAASPDWVEAFSYPEAETSWQGEGGFDEGDTQSSPRPARPRIDTAALLDEPKRAAPPVSAARGSAARSLTERSPTERSPTSLEGAPVKPHAAATDSVTPVRAARSEPAPRFKLAWLVRADLLIVDSLPPHQPEGFSRAHRRLLQGMTRALGMTAEQELSAPFMLPWPMLAGKTLNQGPDEAHKAVQRKLHNTLTFNPEIRQVLLLGEAAGYWVGGLTDRSDALQGKVLELENGRQALMTLSLSELLRLPERKAEVWRDLQPFRRNLKHG